MSIDERFAVISAGFTGDVAAAQAGLLSSDESVRASAVRSLQRLSALTSEHISSCINDASSEVRRTAVEFAAPFLDVSIHHLINDEDVFVAEMTAWSLGERSPVSDEELDALIACTVSHTEAVVREAVLAYLNGLASTSSLKATDERN